MKLSDLAIGFGTAAAILLAAEAVSRWRYRNPSEFEPLKERLYYSWHMQPVEPRLFDLDSTLLWKYHPGFALTFLEPRTGRTFPFRVDENGFRDESGAGVKNAAGGGKGFVLLSLGDSCTAGLEVEENYTKILARKLSETGLPVAVMNAGTSGYSTLQGVRVLDEVLKKGVKPTLAIVHFGHNDSTAGLRGIPDKDLTVWTLYQLRLRKWLTHSYLAVSLFAWLQGEATDERTPGLIAGRVNVDDFRQNLIEIVRKLKAAGARVVLVNSVRTLPLEGVPDLEKLRKDIAYLERYNATAFAVAYEEGAAFYDAYEALRPLGNEAFFNAFPTDPTHPGPEGHRRIAEGLFKQLVRENLVPEHADRPRAAR